MRTQQRGFLPACQPLNSVAMLRVAKPAPRSYGLLLRAVSRRNYANTKPGILSSDPAFLPGSQSPNAPQKTAGVPLGPVSGSPAKPATPIIPPENVPLTPPAPSKVQTAPPTSTSTVSPPPPPPTAAGPTPPPKQKPPRSRRLLYALLFGGVAYGGAVFYALQSDDFHDFFTEYVPFGEQSVLYFEERSFRNRFPNAKHRTYRTTPPSKANDEPRVTIPSRAGLSWKVQDKPDQGSDLTQKGRHMSALDANKPSEGETKNAQQDPKAATPKEKSAAVDKVKKEADPPAPAPAKKTAPEPEPMSEKKSEVVSPPSPATPSPKSDPRPPAIAPVTQLSPLEIANADEPLVQELVKVVNDMITVINADGADASNKYAAPITKAKESLADVGRKIVALKEAERKAAEERVAQAHKEFDEGAKDLLKRIEAAQREDDAKYREEFELEREKIRHIYDERLKAELERTQQLADQKLKNELTEQAIELKRTFLSEIKNMVESERDGRLSKLTDLSSNVNNLQQLTSNWNGVIDSNLQTQKLQVAVDAVRTALTRATAAEAKPQPFVREMAALKLVANGDAVVDAAIASINPSAYQRGIPSPAQLIDRYRRVASEVRKASLLPEDAGVASHAASFILSKVMFKKQGQPQGTDVESVLTRTETLLEEGDLDNAAREMNTLQGWSAVLAKDWLQDCRKVLEVRQALEVSLSKFDIRNQLTSPR
jgi:mitofilin